MNKKLQLKKLPHFILHRKNRIKCFGCNELFDEKSLEKCINNSNDLFCPTCRFIIRLYTKSGIRSEFPQGSLNLNLNFINNQFRKMAKEFQINPTEAETKYLNPTEKTIKISSDEFQSINDFPFVFIPSAFFLDEIKAGENIILSDGHKATKVKINSIEKFSDKKSKKYGKIGVNYVLFIDGNENGN